MAHAHVNTTSAVDAMGRMTALHACVKNFYEPAGHRVGDLR